MHHQVCALNRLKRISQLKQTRPVTHTNVKATYKDPGNIPSAEWMNSKPVTEIPGPSKFEFIRSFLPGAMLYNKSSIDLSLIYREIYGDIYMLPGVFGNRSILMLFNPEDFPKVLRSEGVWPRRSVFSTMSYHRNVHRKGDFGDVTGLLTSNGESWSKLRSAVNPILMQPKNSRLYLNKMLEVNNEFLLRIREIRDPNSLEMPANFEEEINRLTFESVAIVALNRQLGLIRKDRHNADAVLLFSSIRDIFDLTLELDIHPSMWKLIKTPKFHKIMTAYDTMYDTIMKYINQALERIENDKSPSDENEEKSVLEKLLKIDKKVAVVMALDMLFAGVDSTTSTFTGILLQIAKNPEKQRNLRQEIRTILPKKESQLTLENMKNLPYLRACIKEGIRLTPIVAGTLRNIGDDVVLSGYQVPKNQDAIINANLLALQDEFFPKANQFIPERWLRDEKTDHPPVNPFLYIPFSFGPRSCVGKRLVEMELEITVANLVRNFYIEFNYSTEHAFKCRLLNMPAIPLRFKFSDVEN